MGRGDAIIKSSKQNINTKSSIEVKVIGTINHIPNILWGKTLLEHQYNSIQRILLNQDNQSAMRMENNDRRLCG